MIVTAQSFPNSDGMRAQLESHLSDINRTADVAYDSGNSGEAIDLIVVTDSEAILGIGGEQTFDTLRLLVQTRVLEASRYPRPNRHCTPLAQALIRTESCQSFWTLEPIITHSSLIPFIWAGNGLG